ncbi:inactive LRR receptor-like serine/threonine-protein kinase BIR2 [Fagus crenata]
MVVALQSHLIAGLFIESPSISVPSSKADPLHGSPVVFHNDPACASHCWNIEFNAFTVSQCSGRRVGGGGGEIAYCKFLNNLVLSNNRLSGLIPYGLGRLNRLKRFSVANNDLSDSVPADLENFDKSDFDGNDGLCGKPIGSKCGGLSSKSLAIIVAAGIIGKGEWGVAVADEKG